MLLTAWAYFYRQLENRYLQTGKLIFPSCTINILLYKNRVYNRNVDLIGKERALSSKGRWSGECVLKVKLSSSKNKHVFRMLLEEYLE